MQSGSTSRNGDQHHSEMKEFVGLFDTATISVPSNPMNSMTVQTYRNFEDLVRVLDDTKKAAKKYSLSGKNNRTDADFSRGSQLESTECTATRTTNGRTHPAILPSQALKSPQKKRAQSRKSKSKPTFHICMTCQRGFTHSGHRNRHIHTVHLGERRYLCEQCGQTFKQNSHLDSHKGKCHENMKKRM